MQHKMVRDLTRRETFELFTPVTIRFCDTDKLGHVNNVSIAAYIEAGRCDLYYKLMQDAGTDARIDFVLARAAIDFRREIFYPGTVEVGSRFLQLGNRSVTTGYGVFVGDTCVATSECVNVFFDMSTRTSIAPTGTLRTLLEAAIAR
ncbi:MAG: acyl-CoA thioesterase [Hyphomicrobiaceae bacterium]